jgi:hypothetical protein
MDHYMVHAHCMLDSRDYKLRICTYYFLLVHCNNGCTKAPQSYVVRTLLALLYLIYINGSNCTQAYLIMHVG